MAGYVDRRDEREVMQVHLDFVRRTEGYVKKSLERMVAEGLI